MKQGPSRASTRYCATSKSARSTTCDSITWDSTRRKPSSRRLKCERPASACKGPQRVDFSPSCRRDNQTFDQAHNPRKDRFGTRAQLRVAWATPTRPLRSGPRPTPWWPRVQAALKTSPATWGQWRISSSGGLRPTDRCARSPPGLEPRAMPLAIRRGTTAAGSGSHWPAATNAAGSLRAWGRSSGGRAARAR